MDIAPAACSSQQTHHTKIHILHYCANGWGKGEEKQGDLFIMTSFSIEACATANPSRDGQAAGAPQRSLKLFDGMSFCQYKVEDEYIVLEYFFTSINALSLFFGKDISKVNLMCKLLCFGLCKIIFSNILLCCPFFDSKKSEVFSKMKKN